MTSLIGDFKKAGERAGGAATLGSLLPQKVSPKKLLASTIGAASTFQGVLPQLGATFTRAVSDGPDVEKEQVTLPQLNTTGGTFVSQSDPSLANTEQGFMAASQPAPTGSKWKMMAQAAKQDMAVTQPEGDRQMSKARKAANFANALTKAAEESLEENIEMFAQKLVDTFGSLSAAFEALDHHDREEITRSQWDAALNARGWNTEDMCGLNSAKIFSLVCRASKKPTGALTLPAWKSFFKKYLGRSAAHLLTEERPIEEGVSTLLEKFQAPNAVSDTQNKPDVGENTDGIYTQRRGAFIMRPPEDLEKLQEAQAADSDSDAEDVPPTSGVLTHVGSDSDQRGNASKDATEGTGSGGGPGAGSGGGENGVNAGGHTGSQGDGFGLNAASTGGPGSGLGPGGTRNGAEGDDPAGKRDANPGRADGQLGTASAGKGSENSASGEDDRRNVNGHGARKDGTEGDLNKEGRSDQSGQDSTSRAGDLGPHRDGAMAPGVGGAGAGEDGLGGGLVANNERGDGEDGRLAEGSQQGDLDKGGASARAASNALASGARSDAGARDDAGAGARDGAGDGRLRGDNNNDQLEQAGHPSDADPNADATNANAADAEAAASCALLAAVEAAAASAADQLGKDLSRDGNLALAGLFDDDDEEIGSEEPQGKADDFQSIVKQVFRLYATGYSKGRYVFIRNPDLSRFMEDSRALIPGYRRKFRRFKRIFESLFDDTIQLQCDMPGQGVRITAGLTLEWFQVFVQKVVRRVGIEVMSFFAALLESQLY